MVRRDFGVGVGVSLSEHSLPGLNDSPITSLRWSLGLDDTVSLANTCPPPRNAA